MSEASATTPTAAAGPKTPKTKAPLPPLPPSIATAVCLFPVAVLGVLGRPAVLCDVGDGDPNHRRPPVQRTYLKDAPDLTVKLTVTVPPVGMDTPAPPSNHTPGDVVIPSHDCLADAAGQALLRTAVEQALRDLVGQHLPLTRLTEASVRTLLTRDPSVGAESTETTSHSHSHSSSTSSTTATTNNSSSSNNNNNNNVAYIPGHGLCSVEGTPTRHTDTGVRAIRILEWSVRPSPQHRRRSKTSPPYYDVAAKLVVDPRDGVDPGNEELAAEPADAAVVVPESEWKPLLEPRVRCEAGRWLREQIAAARQPESSASSSSSPPPSAQDCETTATPKPTSDADAAPGQDDAMVVNIETVSGKIDYNRLVENFGSSLLTHDHLERLGRLSRLPLHRFLRRGIFFSHRDLDALLNVMEQAPRSPDASSPPPFYLYTGRGPSSESMHMGHLIPFLFTKWLQDAFDVPLVIQMTDDEKFIFKGTYSHETGDNLQNFQRLTVENAKDIIACGFDFQKTFLFSDMDYVGTMYPNIVRIWKAATANTVNAMFGFDGSSNVGKLAFPAIQAAPAFATSFPVVLNQEGQSTVDRMACLIPCAIDQDPYFRLTRDVAHKLVTPPSLRPPGALPHPLGGKPALIHSKFFPPLQGATGKMSSSDTNSAIFLTDSPDEISRKIKQHAFSGGQDTKAKQQELGADLEVDVSYQWLRFFLEDDEELERIGRDYGSGSGEFWSTHKVKERLIQVCQELVAEHQARRATITDEEVRRWMQQRNIVG